MPERTPEEKRVRRIGMLRRRAAHLQRRIAARTDTRLTYDEAELGALRWAIRILEAHPELKGEHA